MLKVSKISCMSNYFIKKFILKTAWLLPYKLIEVSLIPQLGHSLGKVLILPDSDVWFGSLTHESGLTDVYRKIWLAINKLAELHELDWIHGDVKAEHFRNFQQSLI